MFFDKKIILLQLCTVIFPHFCSFSFAKLWIVSLWFDWIDLNCKTNTLFLKNIINTSNVNSSSKLAHFYQTMLFLEIGIIGIQKSSMSHMIYIVGSDLEQFYKKSICFKCISCFCIMTVLIINGPRSHLPTFTKEWCSFYFWWVFMNGLPIFVNFQLLISPPPPKKKKKKYR